MKLLKAAAFYINCVEIKLFLFIAKRWFVLGGWGDYLSHRIHPQREPVSPTGRWLLIDRYRGRRTHENYGQVLREDCFPVTLRQMERRAAWLLKAVLTANLTPLLPRPALGASTLYAYIFIAFFCQWNVQFREFLIWTVFEMCLDSLLRYPF